MLNNRYCFAALGLLLATPAAAHDHHEGPDHNQINGARVDVHANLDRYSVFGSGVRVELAIVPNGFIRGDVHDELALSFGADVFFTPVELGRGGIYDGPYLVPICAVQWNFYLGEHWSVFPEAGVAVHATLDGEGWENGNGHAYRWLYPEPNIGVGARYHFNSHVALLMRVSTPGGLQVGLAF